MTLPREVVMRTASVSVLLGLALLCLAVTGCGGDDEEGSGGGGGETTTAAAAESITVDLGEQNSSGESGTATLTADGEQTTVAVELSGAPATPQPAHIHDGTCATLGDVVYPLTNVENGASETTVDAPLSDLQGADYDINVHESEEMIQTYVACGDIPKS
jgi:Cu/Zn superoxide dismutase